MPTTKPQNPYAQAYAGFREQTANHELSVLHDDGLYRHLRMQVPGTRIWSWDVVTWPGHLATSGDIADGYTFTRLTDMLTFFDVPSHLRTYYSDGAPCIDVRYWAEKLCGGRSRDVQTYNSASFLRQVREHLEEDEEIGLEAEAFRHRQIALLERIRELKYRGVGADASPTVEERLHQHWLGKLTPSQLFDTDGLTQDLLDQLGLEFAVNDDGSRAQFDLFDLETRVEQRDPAEMRADKLDEARWQSDDEYSAHTWLSGAFGHDTVEWDLREYDVYFLNTCYAIDMTVQAYRAHQTTTAAQEAAHV